MSIEQEKGKVELNKQKRAEEKFVEAEQRYRTLVDSMSEGLLQVDNDDIIIFANQKFCEMSGYSLGELVGKVGHVILFDEKERKIIEEKKASIEEKGIKLETELKDENDMIKGDIFWLKDESLEDTDNLPEPDVLAKEIIENLEAALDQFNAIYEELEAK